MPVLILLLAAGVFAYFVWRSRTSSLTRECRWRLHRHEGKWSCAFCGAVSHSAEQPSICLKGKP